MELTDEEFAQIGRIFILKGDRDPQDQDSRGWNKLYNSVMLEFKMWKSGYENPGD